LNRLLYSLLAHRLDPPREHARPALRATSPVSLIVALWLLMPAVVSADGRPPSPVTLTEVISEQLREQVELTGTTTAWRQAALSTRVDGLVTALEVDDGSIVEAGAPILRLDARLAELERDAAAARMREAEARHQDAIRIRDELLSLKRGRHASETETQTAIANVEMAAAALSAERAALAQAEELVDRHALAAPFAGMVIARHLEVGEWAKRDQAAIELVALERLRIRATLPQRDFNRVVAGSPVIVRLDAVPDRPFEGEVLARIASADPRSRSFPLLIDLPNPDRLLAPGMSARVTVELDGKAMAALTVPRDAIVAKSDGSREVWRVSESDGGPTVHPVTIETGRASGDRVEVIGGDLHAGDRIVLLGNERLRPGQRVAPRRETAETAAIR
jgi:RND family efflux transporter MFP subunit